MPIPQEALSQILQLALQLDPNAQERLSPNFIDLAAQYALAYCSRDDIPPSMFLAVALLALNLLNSNPGIKSISRGDTSFQFDSNNATISAILGPFRKLPSIQQEVLP